MRVGRRVLAGVVRAIALAGCGQEAPDRPPPAPGDPYFGINAQFVRQLADRGLTEDADEHLDAIADAGIGFVRTHFEWWRPTRCAPSR
jgi:hypothetical protein